MAVMKSVKNSTCNLQPMYEIQFTSLNEDCLYEIFEWLPLYDLCELSKTCRRLLNFTGNYFQRKYSYKWMHVSNTRADGIILSPRTNYVKCFNKLIQNISIDLLRKDHYVMLDFLQTDCNNRPKKVQFKCAYLPEYFGDSFQTLLKYVETVSFRNCRVDDATILLHCDRIKNLYVVENLLNDQYERIEELLLSKYLTLEHFHCSYGGLLSIDKLQTFLKKNDTIKSITWHFLRRHWNIIIDCIESIEIASNLQKLFLSFDGDEYNLVQISRKLQVLCDRDQFKRLELQFIGESAEQKLNTQGHELASLRSLTGLHLYGFQRYENVIPLLHKLPYLKTLQLKNDYEVYRSTFPLPNQSLYAFPNLEQLHLNGLLKNFNYIHAFVSNSQKLAKIVVKDCAFTEFHISELNAVRQKLPDACETIIYTEQFDITSNLNYNLVKIKRVEFEDDEFNVIDPFICYSMEVHRE